MTPTPDAQQTPFQSMMEHQNGSNIQDFLNPIHDAIFKFKNITEKDQEELSKLLQESCGDHIFNEFMSSKRKEWDSFRTYVSQWELDKYLERY